MSTRLSGYPGMLEALGHEVTAVGGITWFRYNGFLRPARLPHATPLITAVEAHAALRETGAMFARWEQSLGRVAPTHWWHVLRRGPYALEQLSGNTRSKVRRGSKRLTVRVLTSDDVRLHCRGVCEAAIARYNDTEMLPPLAHFERLADALHRFPGHLEIVGVWRGEALVGYAETHLDDGAALINTLWYDPDALGDYASYVLMHGVLDRYLTERGLRYVSDGARMLYHRTTVHEFLVDKFGFERGGAQLQVAYRPVFTLAVRASFPWRNWVQQASARWDRSVLHKVSGILEQERIFRAQRATAGS